MSENIKTVLGVCAVLFGVPIYVAMAIKLVLWILGL